MVVKRKSVEKETIVRVIVEGPETGKEHALLGLLREANYEGLRKAISCLAPSQVVRIAVEEDRLI